MKKSKHYYMITRDGEPVLYGDKVPLHTRKKDAAPLKGDKVEKVRIVRVKKAAPKKKPS